MNILSNVRGWYLYNKAKPRGINTLHNAVNYYFSSIFQKRLNNDERSDDTIRSVIGLVSDDNK